MKSFRLWVIVGFYFTIITYCLGILFNSVSVVYLGMTMIYGLSLLYGIHHFKQNSLFFLFTISSFTFLAARFYSNALLGYKLNVSTGMLSGRFIYNDDSLFSYFSIVLISQAFLFITTFVYDLITIKNTDAIYYPMENDHSVVRRITKTMFFLLFPFAFFIVIQKIAIVSSIGYVGSYIDADVYSLNNSFLGRLSNLYLLNFFAFLSTKPTKQQFKIPVILHLIYCCLLLGTGTRGPFISNILFLIWFFSYIDKAQLQNQILTRSRLIGGVLSSVVLVFLMQVLSYVRSNSEIQLGFISNILFFFSRLGVTSDVVLYYLDNRNLFLGINGLRYLFGPFIDLISKNGLVLWLLGAHRFSGNSLSYALNENNLAHLLSYFILGKRYLTGMGVGSSYLIECHFAFGTIGVAIYSLLLALFFSFISQRSYGKWWVTTILMYIINGLFLVPRASALGWLTAWISPIYISYLFFVFILSMILKNAQSQIRV